MAVLISIVFHLCFHLNWASRPGEASSSISVQPTSANLVLERKLSRVVRHKETTKESDSLLQVNENKASAHQEVENAGDGDSDETTLSDDDPLNANHGVGGSEVLRREERAVDGSQDDPVDLSLDTHLGNSAWEKKKKAQWAVLEEEIAVGKVVIRNTGQYGKIVNQNCQANTTTNRLAGGTTSSCQVQLEGPSCVDFEGEAASIGRDDFVSLEKLNGLMVEIKPNVQQIGDIGILQVPEDDQCQKDWAKRTYPVKVYKADHRGNFLDEGTVKQLLWEEFTVLQRPVTVESLKWRLSTEKRAQLAELHQNAQGKLQSHLKTEIQKHLSPSPLDDQGRYKDGFRVVVWFPSPGQEYLKEQLGQVRGFKGETEDDSGGKINMYEIELDDPDIQEANGQSGNPVMSEDQFFPVVSGRDEPGEARYLHEVFITKQSVRDLNGNPLPFEKLAPGWQDAGRGWPAVITSVHWRDGQWEYKAEASMNSKDYLTEHKDKLINRQENSSQVLNFGVYTSPGCDGGETPRTFTRSRADGCYAGSITETPLGSEGGGGVKFQCDYEAKTIMLIPHGDPSCSKDSEQPSKTVTVPMTVFTASESCVQAASEDGTYYMKSAKVSPTNYPPCLKDDTITEVVIHEGEFIDQESAEGYATHGAARRTMGMLRTAERNHERRKKKAATRMTEEEYKEYKELAKKYWQKEFPAAEKVSAEDKKISAEMPKDKFGKRHQLLEDMIDGLFKPVINARMLAGEDDRQKGIEANVDEWAKQGLTYLGNSRGSAKLADVVLRHFKHAHEKSRKEDYWKGQQIGGVGADLEQTSDNMAKYGITSP